MVKTYFYDPSKSVEYHIEHGPLIEGIEFKNDIKKGNFTFLGQQVNSLFGAPAFALTMDHRWTSVLSRLGFDIITYKTVRTVKRPPNPWPNWMFVNSKHQLAKEDLEKPIIGSIESFKDQELSTANSFGVPSNEPEYWKTDFEKAKNEIQEGQLLILSIMTSAIEGRTQVEDAKILAQYAAETSAEAFEINFACPNTEGEGLIYEDVDLTIKICEQLKAVIGNRPLLVKVGYYRNQNDLKRFMTETNGTISGISSTNTFAMKIVNTEGKSAFGDREVAGVAGAAVRNLAHEQINTIMKFKNELQLSDFTVVAIGGISKPEHIQEYVDMGVQAVQAASALWQNPYLAYQFKEKYL